MTLPERPRHPRCDSSMRGDLLCWAAGGVQVTPQGGRTEEHRGARRTGPSLGDGTGTVQQTQVPTGQRVSGQRQERHAPPCWPLCPPKGPVDWRGTRDLPQRSGTPGPVAVSLGRGGSCSPALPGPAWSGGGSWAGRGRTLAVRAGEPLSLRHRALTPTAAGQGARQGPDGDPGRSSSRLTEETVVLRGTEGVHSRPRCSAAPGRVGPSGKAGSGLRGQSAAGLCAGACVWTAALPSRRPRSPLTLPLPFSQKARKPQDEARHVSLGPTWTRSRRLGALAGHRPLWPPASRPCGTWCELK